MSNRTHKKLKPIKSKYYQYTEEFTTEAYSFPSNLQAFIDKDKTAVSLKQINEVIEKINKSKILDYHKLNKKSKKFCKNSCGNEQGSPSMRFIGEHINYNNVFMTYYDFVSSKPIFSKLNDIHQDYHDIYKGFRYVKTNEQLAKLYSIIPNLIEYKIKYFKIAPNKSNNIELFKIKVSNSTVKAHTPKSRRKLTQRLGLSNEACVNIEYLTNPKMNDTLQVNTKENIFPKNLLSVLENANEHLDIKNLIYTLTLNKNDNESVLFTDNNHIYYKEHTDDKTNVLTKLDNPFIKNMNVQMFVKYSNFEFPQCSKYSLTSDTTDSNSNILDILNEAIAYKMYYYATNDYVTHDNYLFEVTVRKSDGFKLSTEIKFNYNNNNESNMSLEHHPVPPAFGLKSRVKNPAFKEPITNNAELLSRNGRMNSTSSRRIRSANETNVQNVNQ
jgi:hypothetical protein